ncbi:putative Na+/H+ antiporter [Propionivibrio sp.]|uniref:putative Na+/H+ antiporter n=1 Tax=Propionivibrio sp. TaxID=2212460 RepID=UPI0039E4BCA5
MAQTILQWVAAALFFLAILHTFSTVYFARMAHRHVEHAGVFHLLGEVEVVFGVWAMLLVIAMAGLLGRMDTIDYLDSRNFTEPMFVFAIMVVAASKPILHFSRDIVRFLATLLPLQSSVAFYFVSLSFVPLLGSFITEPAAMTLAAFMLRDMFFSRGISTRLKYATIGALFVNVSIGGVLTPFAAPPVLMVAGKWGWDIAFMITTFGWKAALAVGVNALAVTYFFRRELRELRIESPARRAESDMPRFVTAMHLLFLTGVIVFAHHPPIFMGLLLFFLGFASAYKRYQDRLILREGLLVSFFLAGLVVLGGQQQWWLQELLLNMDASSLYFGATALTAVTDNAALTYLGSLVEGLPDDFKYALVAGAVSGGGLTVIANAPNPAGFAILKGHFPGQTIRAPGLLLAALPPTLVVILVFYVL